MVGKDSLSRLRAFKEDPVLFSRQVLGFQPFDYQERLLRDCSKRIVACMGRQTGKSTTIATKALWFALTHPRTTTIIVSSSLRQSMLMFDKIASYVDGPWIKPSLRYRSKTRIKFSNGSWIIALPCGRFGYSLRGYTADLVILDEASFIPEEVITSVVLPMISSKDGFVWMLSTPWDKDHIFYRAFSDKSLGWSVYHLPSSANPMIKPSFLEEQLRLIGEERFRMEYLAEFVDDERSYFPMRLLRPCIDPEIECEPIRGMYVGFDPGGKESLAASLGLVKHNGSLRVCYWRSVRLESYAEENEHLAGLNLRAPFSKLLVDQTGLGAPIVEHLKALGLPAEGISLNEQAKEALFSNLKLLLESRGLSIPKDPNLLNSLNCIEYRLSNTGHLRFTHRPGTKDDLAYALALACQAAKMESRPSGVVIRA